MRFGSSRIRGRLVDHDIAALQRSTNVLRCLQDRGEVRASRSIDYPGNRDQKKIRRRNILRAVRQRETGKTQVGAFELARAIATLAQLFDAARVAIKTDDRNSGL